MPSLCHFDWGPAGASRAAQRGDLVVLVDTLSFSTCAAIANMRQAYIYPCADRQEADRIKKSHGGEIAVGRKEVPYHGKFSLSPLTYADVDPGARIILPSPNGAVCSRCCSMAEFVMTGAFVNARALALAVNEILKHRVLNTTVIACGERVETDIADNIRWAIEDYLGAGAIISYLRTSKSIEAQLCESVFIRNHDRINVIMLECESGRELSNLGFRNDVIYSAQLNLCQSVPILRNGRFENLKK